MKKIATIFIAIIISNYIGFAQGSSWKIYQQITPIVSVCVDTNNAIWAASDRNGLTILKNGKWEIIRTENSSINSNYLKHINKDKNGDIWIVFPLQIMQLKNYQISFVEYDNFTSNAAFDNLNNLWIGTKNGLRMYNGKSWTTFSQFDYSTTGYDIKTVKVDSKNNIWFGVNPLNNSQECKLICFNPTTLNVKEYEYFKSCLPISYINNLAIDNNDNKWISTSKGLIKINDSICKFYNLNNSGLEYNQVFDVLIDDNIKWIVQYGDGLGKYSLIKFNDTIWTSYNKINSKIPEHGILSLAIDEKKSLWLGTANNGVFSFKDIWKNENRFFKGTYSSNIINSLAVDKVDVKWFGLNNFLERFDDSTWNRFETPYKMHNSSLKVDYVNKICIDSKNAKWVGTKLGGLGRFGKTNFTNIYDQITSNLPSDNVTSIVVDKYDAKWLGTPKGLVKYNDTTFNTFLSTLYVTSLGIDTLRNIWVGSISNGGTEIGLLKFDGNNLTQFNSQNSPINGFLKLSFILVDNNNHIWTHNDKGLLRYDGINWNKYLYSEIGYKNGFKINNAKIDRNNILWFATNIGLLRFDYKDWRMYNVLNSDLPINEVLDIDFDKKGNIWIGTNGGGVGVMEDCIIDTTIIKTTDSYEVKIVADYYQWFSIIKDEIKIETSNQRIFKPQIKGKYFVSIRRGNCEALSSVFEFDNSIIDTTLLITDYIRSNSTIYPNPTSGKIKIISTSDINNVMITNSLGQLILEPFEYKEKDIDINLSNLPNGIYFLKLNSINYKIIKI